MAFLTVAQIQEMGFKKVGTNVLISDKASFYNPGKIQIGSDSRIDDFCILSAGNGGIVVGNHVHIACYSSLIGMGKITLDDFSNISSKVAIYSSNDDYSGNSLTGPTVPEEYKKVTCLDVIIGKHVIIGSGSVVLPGVQIGIGSAIGALSLVNKSCDDFYIYSGIPVKPLKPRSKNLLDLEQKFLSGKK